MKYKLVLCLLLVGLMTACGDNSPVLELSETTFDVDDQATTLTVQVNSSSDWTASSSSDWCTLTNSRGTGNSQANLSIKANTMKESRTATIVLNMGEISKKVVVNQKGLRHLDLSGSLFNITSKAKTIDLTVTSNVEWKAESNADWCLPSLSKANGTVNMSLSVQANTGTQSNREASVVFTSGTLTATVKIVQAAAVDLATYHYEIPVVFHLLYDSAAKASQNPTASRISTLLAACNNYFKGQASPYSVDMNMEFVLATLDPSGAKLPEAGINRVQLTNSKIDCESFMDNPTYVYLRWNPNNYINIFVYEFTDSRILGISNLPYSPSTNALEGLPVSDNLYTALPSNFPYCVSLNNSYIASRYDGEPEDFSVTLTHELGHYMGLRHVFSDGNECVDTDYCEDTPTYNMAVYERQLVEAVRQGASREVWYNRTSCSGSTFVAHNLMDYSYCYFDQFTDDQRKRIRYVLMNSPMMPGPKNERTRSRSLTDNTPPVNVFMP